MMERSAKLGEIPEGKGGEGKCGKAQTHHVHQTHTVLDSSQTPKIRTAEEFYVRGAVACVVACVNT
jgi:hypothetical protein